MKPRIFPSFVAVAIFSFASGSARADDTSVLVHISSKGPARLERRDVGKAWVTVCDAPCDREVPLGDEYRIGFGKKGLTHGAPFRLNAASDAVELKVQPPSPVGEASGTALVVIGGAVALVGALGLIVSIGLAVHPETPCHTDWCIDPHSLAGALALVSGFGLLLGGGVLAGGASIIGDAQAKTTQRPWAGREPTWAVPQVVSARKAAVFAPLSLSF